MCIEKQIINNKIVYVFESHHYALFPWAELKRKYEDMPLNLFSFDYHTDIHEPFLDYCYDRKSNKLNRDKSEEMVREIDFHSDNSIRDAILKLKNDEHIKTAISCGILSHAFIIAQEGKEKPLSYEESKRLDDMNNNTEIFLKYLLGDLKITPGELRTYPPADIYMPDFDCYENEDILDDSFLNRKLQTLSRMSSLINNDGILVKPYILDIDLDYFTYPEAVKPNSKRIFANLARNAEIITVAKESACVSLCSQDKCNADELLKGLIHLFNDILQI